MKIRGKNPDDEVAFVEHQGAADDGGIPGEAALPESMIEDDDAIAAGLIFVGEEDTACSGRRRRGAGDSRGSPTRVTFGRRRR